MLQTSAVGAILLAGTLSQEKGELNELKFPNRDLVVHFVATTPYDR